MDTFITGSPVNSYLSCWHRQLPDGIVRILRRWILDYKCVSSNSPCYSFTYHGDVLVASDTRVITRWSLQLRFSSKPEASASSSGLITRSKFASDRSRVSSDTSVSALMGIARTNNKRHQSPSDPRVVSPKVLRYHWINVL